ncbi:hypothetical protein BD770DRAFT_409048 [Pilaira anomala]|nr:hypothetical protein BD770DRAFT_409048 [Pilaira anomala]
MRLFAANTDSELWDEYGLLSKPIRHCPNHLKIYCHTQDLSFWFRVSHAASREHLSRLQFYNLQSLRVERFYYSEEITPRSCPYNILTDFLHNATAIPEFGIDIILRYEDLRNVMTELINMKSIYKDISVSFADSQPNVNRPLLKIKATTLYFKFPFPDHPI